MFDFTTIHNAVVALPWILGIALLTALAYKVTSSLRHKATIKAIIRKHGCQEAAKWPQKDPWGSELIKSRSNAMRDGQYRKLYEDQYKEIGRRTFYEIVRGEVIINTIDPLNFKKVMTADRDFGKPSSGRALPFMGISVLMDGPHHRRIRALLRPAFSKAEHSNTYRLRPFAEHFFQLLPPTGTVFDIQPLLDKLFLDVSTDYVFGRAIDAMGDNSEEAARFFNAFQTALRWTRVKSESGWMGFQHNWNPEYREACSVVHGFIDDQIACLSKDTSRGLETDFERPGSLLAELAKDISNPIELRHQTLGIFLPAHKTTAIAIGNVLFDLARHPEVWIQLRPKAITAKEPLSVAELKSSKFDDLRHVILESFRHVGGVRQTRIALRDTIIPAGGGRNEEHPVFVAKGTRISMHTGVRNRDADRWDHPNEFRPERWVDQPSSDSDFFPFGLGPRICPAVDQSMIQMVYLLVKLLQRYERIENHDPVHEYVEKWTMGIESKNGVKIAFR